MLQAPQALQAAQVRDRTDRPHPTHILMIRCQVVNDLADGVELVEFAAAHDDGLVRGDGYLDSLLDKAVKVRAPLLGTASGHVEADAREALQTDLRPVQVKRVGQNHEGDVRVRQHREYHLVSVLLSCQVRNLINQLQRMLAV